MVVIGKLAVPMPSGPDQGFSAGVREQLPSPGGREPPAGAATELPSPVDAEHSEAHRLKTLLTNPGMRVSLQRDEASGRVMMRVEDRSTGEVVEQIPSDELLRLYAALREPLIDQEA